MPYVKTEWVNNSAPDIDADNLNHKWTGCWNGQFKTGVGRTYYKRGDRYYHGGLRHEY